MITRDVLQARHDQLVQQRDEMIAADQAEHERMVAQINACGGAVQLCDMLLAELDLPAPRPSPIETATNERREAATLPRPVRR